MDVDEFSRELLRLLAHMDQFSGVTLHTEGPVAEGRATVDEETFVHFFYNEITGTLAFALIKNERRIWGIDFDNRRGWHLHPAENPEAHQEIEPLQVSEIILRLNDVILTE